MNEAWQPVSAASDVSFAFSQFGFSTTSAAPVQSGPIDGEPDLISFLSLVQKEDVNLLPITWQPALQSVGFGGTAEIKQSLINLQTSFAFKRFRRPGVPLQNEEAIYRTLISEVLVLSHPAVFRHPNIIRLEGVCWDVPLTEDKVWPVLVFEKSRCGDLDWFMNCGAGVGLPVLGRLSLSTDILAAVVEMHTNGIIHGDIKPQNVLIFNNNNNPSGYTAKVLDFGYSTIYANEHDLISMPSSQPWAAPEYHHRGFKAVEAKKMDIYSSALLCLWLLCKEGLTGTVATFGDAFEGNQCAEGCKRACKEHQMQNLSSCKSQGKLLALANQVLMTMTLEYSRKDELRQFFTLALDPNAGTRCSDLIELISLLGTKRSVSPKRVESLQAVQSENLNHFQITLLMRHLCTVDYRVRQHIITSMYLRTPPLFSDTPSTLSSRSSSCRSIAFEFALCLHIGFGTPRDVSKSQEYLSQCAKGTCDVDRALETLRQKDDIQIYRKGNYYNRLSEGYISHSTARVAQFYLEQHQLSSAATVYEREISDIGSILNRCHWPLWELISILTEIYLCAGRLGEAYTLQTECVKTCAETLGEIDPRTRSSKYRLAKVLFKRGRLHDAEALLTQVMDLEKEIHGEDHPSTLSTATFVATLHYKQGKFARAEQLTSQVLILRERTLGREHYLTLQDLDNLALIYMAQGRWKDAERLREELLETATRVLGPSHGFTTECMTNLASTYQEQGRLRSAEQLADQALKVRRDFVGQKHPDNLAGLNNQSIVYLEQGRFNEAEKVLQEVLETEFLDTQHPDRLITQGNLAIVYQRQGRWEEAEALSSSTLKAKRSALGPSHPKTLAEANSLAFMYQQQSRWLDAFKLQAEVIDTLSVGENPKALKYLANLLPTCRNLGKWEEAERKVDQILEAQRSLQGPEHQHILDSIAAIAMDSDSPEQGHGKEETLTRQVFRLQKHILGAQHQNTLNTMNNLAQALCRQKTAAKCAEAESMLREVVALAETTLGTEHDFTLLSMHNLALALRDQGHGGEAERVDKEKSERFTHSEYAIGCDSEESLNARKARFFSGT